jgi:hypothetical protein
VLAASQQGAAKQPPSASCSGARVADAMRLLDVAGERADVGSAPGRLPNTPTKPPKQPSQSAESLCPLAGTSWPPSWLLSRAVSSRTPGDADLGA